MNASNDSMPNDRERDALDPLLDQAEWPAVEADRLERLESHWKSLSPARPRGQRRWGRLAALLAVAAALLVGILLRQNLSKTARDAPVAPYHPTVVVPEQPILPKPNPGPSLDPITPAPRRPRPPVSRPPTALETFVAQAQQRSSLARPVTDREGVLQPVIEARLAEPAGDLSDLVGPLLAERAHHEMTLLWHMQSAQSAARRKVAIELLGWVGSDRAVPVLLEASRHGEFHAPATRALARLADSELVGRLAQAESDTTLQQELLAELFARRDGRSLAVFLASVRDRSTFDSALAVLDAATDPPLEELLAFFDSSRQQERYAAALVLGRINEPAASQRLINMVLHDQRRREALFALVARDDDQAALFVDSAGHDPTLQGLVLAAQHQAKTLMPFPEEANQ